MPRVYRESVAGSRRHAMSTILAVSLGQFNSVPDWNVPVTKRSVFRTIRLIARHFRVYILSSFPFG